MTINLEMDDATKTVKGGVGGLLWSQYVKYCTGRRFSRNNLHNGQDYGPARPPRDSVTITPVLKIKYKLKFKSPENE